MGLDRNGLKFILYARRKGVSFRRTALIGRQRLLLGAKDLFQIMTEAGETISLSEAASLFKSGEGYAEPLFRYLGGEEVISLDKSSYEGASRLHDFNLPIGEDYKERFDAVFDGGTLEHVFNYPQALKNCMEMIKTGGCFLAITPVNNHPGHGFYQFSPALFFRVFSPENGFQLEKLFLCEHRPRARWYEVSDPQVVRERVIFTNTLPAFLLVLARKISSVPVFARYPELSDYVRDWRTPARLRVSGEAPGRWLRRFFPAGMVWGRKGGAFLRPFPPRFFRRRKE